jgi:hypothetical protein
LANSGTLIHPQLSTVIYGEHKFNTIVFVTQVFAATSGDRKRHHKECFVMKIYVFVMKIFKIPNLVVIGDLQRFWNCVLGMGRKEEMKGME